MEGLRYIALPGSPNHLNPALTCMLDYNGIIVKGAKRRGGRSHPHLTQVLFAYAVGVSGLSATPGAPTLGGQEVFQCGSSTACHQQPNDQGPTPA